MNVLGHIIADDQIIGISPLFRQPCADATAYTLYERVSLDCYLHCKHQSILIKSEYFNLVENEGKNQFKDYREKYIALAKTIAAMVAGRDELPLTALRFGQEDIEDGTYLVLIKYENDQCGYSTIERFAGCWMGDADIDGRVICYRKLQDVQNVIEYQKQLNP